MTILNVSTWCCVQRGSRFHQCCSSTIPGVALLVFLILLAGCDSALIETHAPRPEPPISLPYPGPKLLAEVTLEFDPAIGAVRETIISTPAPADFPTQPAGVAQSTVWGFAATVVPVEQHLTASSKTCDKCSDGVAGEHTVGLTLRPTVELLAHLKAINFRCEMNCSVVDSSTSPATLPEVMGPDETFTVSVKVSVGTPGKFVVKFGVVGEVVKVTLCLVDVKFFGDHVINLDGSGDIEDPVWIDGNCDGFVETNKPVAYTRDALMRLDVQLTVKVEPALSQPLLADVVGESGYPMKFTYHNVSLLNGTVVFLPPLDADAGLGPQVKVIDQLQFQWSFTLQKQPARPHAFAASTHLVYVTFGDPISPVFLTVLDHSTRNAAGQSNDTAAVVTAIWEEFSDREVFKRTLNVATGRVTAGGAQLTYWQHFACDSVQGCTVPGTVPCGGKGTSARETEELLENEDGECGSWAAHFKTALGTHGIASHRVGIIAAASNNAYGRFLVKTWTFVQSTPVCGPDGWSFHWTDLTDERGAGGQGNKNPPGAFVNHFLVYYDSAFYDPSYGTGPFSSLSDWEDASIDGFENRVTNCVRQDTKGTAEVFVYGVFP
jgi:hypothetical protein